uniref:tetratricopeptide repeat protein n=1 Tax=Aliarcobacter cryaerophilus TaxID=28198 RepID=UPI000ABB6F17
EKAAIQGHSESQYNLGLMYYKGQGVKQNYKKSFEWFEKAANQGYVNAQYNLGVMYENGDGVNKNYKKVKEYFGKACEGGKQLACDKYKSLNQ